MSTQLSMLRVDISKSDVNIIMQHVDVGIMLETLQRGLEYIDSSKICQTCIYFTNSIPIEKKVLLTIQRLGGSA